MNSKKNELAPLQGLPLLSGVPTASAPVLTMKQTVAALFRGKKLLLLMTLVGTLVGGWLALLKPNEYLSVATFRFRPGAEDIRVDPASNPEQGPGRYALRSNAQEILLSEELLLRVVDELGVAYLLAPYEPKLPGGKVESFGDQLRSWIYGLQRRMHKSSGKAASESDALIALRDRLRLDAPANSDLLRVVYRANSPERARKVLQTYIKRAQERHLEVYGAAAIIQLIKQDFAAVEESYSEARTKLRAFLEENGIRDFATDFTESQVEHREARRDHERLKAKVAADAVTIQSLEKQLSDTKRYIPVKESTPVVNPRIEVLQNRISENESQLENLIGRLQEKDPEIVRLRGAIKRLKTDLAREQAKPTEFRVTERVEESQAWATMRAQLTQLRTEQLIDKRKLPEAKTRLENAVARNDQLARVADQYRTLSSKVETERQGLEAARSRLQIARTKQELDQKKVSSLQVLNLPNLPLTKEGPDRARIVIGGLLGGFFLGVLILILRALTDTKIRQPEELEKRLGIKVLATVPSLSRGQLRRHSNRKVTGWS